MSTRLRFFTEQQIASAKRQPSVMEIIKEKHSEAIRRMTPAERAVAFKNHNELIALAFAAGERQRQGR